MKQANCDSANPEYTPASQLPGAPAAESILTQRTNALCRGLRLVLEHHDASAEVLGELERQVHHYLDLALSETVWLKRCKHMLTYPLAKYLRNDPPAPPDAVFQPAGRLRAWMKIRLLVFSRKNTHLWYSWFQSKRATLPLSEDFIAKTYEDHYATLSKEDDGDDATINAIFADSAFQKALSNIRKQFNQNYSERPPFDTESASTSACFEASRGFGGQNGALLREVGVTETRYGELHSMRWAPLGYSSLRRVLNPVFSVYQPFADDRGRWRSLRQRILAYQDGPLSCIIQAVLEPNKVRVISKGESLPYYSCRPIQKALHGAMRHLAPFRLIGRPFCPTDVIDLSAKAQRDWKWFSIDYSAATDGLSWKYSGRILQEILADLPVEETYRALQVLGPHRLYYPTPHAVFGPNGGRPEYKGMQTNGQLMGSILSFPILCLANLGVYLLASQATQRSWTYKERMSHVLVNGDDMVYAAHQALWETHVDIGKKVGLAMSVGKAYVHPVYLNVNSTSVHYDLRLMPTGMPRRDLATEPTPYQIDYLNAGLFFGQHKVQEKEAKVDEDLTPSENSPKASELAQAHLGQDPTRGLVTNLPCVLSGSLPGQQCKLLKKFLNVHGSEVGRECFSAIKRDGRFHPHTRNLFLPLSSGGMGVKAPIGWSFRVTKADRHVAKTMEWLPYARTTQRPLPLGWELSSVDDFVNCPWTKPLPGRLDFPEIKASGSKLATAKAVTGCVYYSATFALDGLIDKPVPHHLLPQHEIMHADQQMGTSTELMSKIDAFYAANPVGTYDRHLVMRCGEKSRYLCV